MSYFNAPIERDHYSARVQSLFTSVFIWMTLGLLVTTAVAFITVSTPLINLAASPLVWVAFLVEIGLVMWLGAGINRMSMTTAATVFLIYAAVNGFSLSLILLFYNVGTLGAAFLSTAALFGSMVIVGRTTSMDLSRMGTYLFIGLIGLIIASIINIFIGSSTADFIISLLGVIIFTGLTAYDAQKIQQMAMYYDGNSSIAIHGALRLYLDFINLFIFLLRLFANSQRRN